MYTVNIVCAQEGYIESIELSDGLEVKLILFTDNTNEQLKAYYLPANFRIARDEKNRKQYSFTKYKSEKDEGSIFHILMTWGLTKNQMLDLQYCIDDQFEDSIQLMGAYNLESASGIQINGKSIISDIFRNASKKIIRVPLNPGQKMAMAIKLNKEETDNMDRFLSSKRLDKDNTLEIEFDFYYRSAFDLRIGRKHEKHQLMVEIKELF